MANIDLCAYILYVYEYMILTIFKYNIYMIYNIYNFLVKYIKIYHTHITYFLILLNDMIIPTLQKNTISDEAK